MWLLNTKSQDLKYFQGNQIPSRYAILSHRWQDEEVTFEDIYDKRESCSLKHGWSKVINCCQVAQSDGFDYVWIDSCCIDKRSSAELSEAINSMYEWYHCARLCYTYLFDVHDAQDRRQFQGSSWFTRSWTLQELLAPAEMLFFTAAWHRIGSKSEMSETIHELTSIPRSALEHFDSSEYSIAQRMSWAAERDATRVEDIAYSLLGIFDINMPLLYGEGEKAFQRLQEAVMSFSNDLSLFIWQGKSCPRFGMLAASPVAFLRSECRVLPLSRGYGFNNAGLFVDLDIQPLFLSAGLVGVYAASLRDPHCASVEGTDFRIYVMKDAHSNRYRRVAIRGKYWNAWSGSTSSDTASTRMCQLLIQKQPVIECIQPRVTGFVIRGCPPGVQVYSMCNVPESESMGTSNNPVFGKWIQRGEGNGGDIHVTLPLNVACRMIGYLAWQRVGDNDFMIVCFGYDFDFHPVCMAFAFPGDQCRHPLMGLSATLLMSRYHRIISGSVSSGSARAVDANIWAIKGEQRTGYKTDLAELKLSIRFLPTKPALCRLYISFGSVAVSSTKLPTRTTGSMTKLRHLLGAAVVRPHL